MNEDELRRAGCAVLVEHGPLTVEEIAEHLVAAGHAEAADVEVLTDAMLSDPDDDVDDDVGAFPLADGRLAQLEQLLDGVTLTCRATKEDLAWGRLSLGSDLSLLHWLASWDGERVPLSGGLLGGGTLTIDADADTIHGPGGWLKGSDQRHPVLTLVLRQGAVEVNWIEELPPLDRAVAGKLAATFEVLAEAGTPPPDGAELLIEARAHHADLLATPGAPLSDLIAAAELVTGGPGPLRRVGDPVPDPADFPDVDDAGDLDDDELAALVADATRSGPGDVTEDVAVTALLGHLRDGHGLDEATADAVLAVADGARGVIERALVTHLEAVTAAGPGAADVPVDRWELAGNLLRADGSAGAARAELDADDELAAATQLAMGHEGGASALLHDAVAGDVLAAVGLRLLVDAADLELDRIGQANHVWLRAKLLEYVAPDHGLVERELRRVIELDPVHAEALFDLAEYRALRGEAGPALGLLRKLEDDGGDAIWLALLEHFAAPGPSAKAGRNDECPCGSLEKFKVCCGLTNGHPLADRVHWAYDKVARFAVSPYSAELSAEVVAVASARGVQVGEDEVLANLVMFDGGTVAAFVDRRGALLPEDERIVLGQARNVRAGAYEVTAVDEGVSVSVTDRRPGGRDEVLADIALSEAVAVGDLLLAWVVPTPAGPMPVSGLASVPPHVRASLLSLLEDDPTPAAIAAWYVALLGT